MVTKHWVQNSKELGHCLFHRFFLTQVYFIWSKFTLKLWEGAWGLTSSVSLPMFLDSLLHSIESFVFSWLPHLFFPCSSLFFFFERIKS